MIYEIDSEGEGIYENKFGNSQVQQNKSAFNQQSQFQEVQQKTTESKIIGEKDFKMLSTKNILGKITFLRWTRRKNFFFGLDMSKGRILCYKAEDSKKPTTYYTIVKGQFLNEGDTNDMTIIKLKSKKGKVFTIELNEEKDPQLVRDYFRTCFDLNIQNGQLDDDTQYKGFFAMLGKGVASIFQVPFRVMTGILVSDKLPTGSQLPLNPNHIFNEQNKKQKEKYIPVSGMFFGTSSIVKEILGSVAVLHGQYQEAESIFSLSQDISSGESNCAVALIFKPVLGTIDMVLMKMSNREFLMERELYTDIFKVRRVKKQGKKLKQKQIQAEKERQYFEYQMGIDDTKMEQVTKNDQEILYLKKDNGILNKNDIEKMHRWGQAIKLGDFDHTKKREEDYQFEQEICNEMLDFYKKKKIDRDSQTQFQSNEDSCEFMIIYPTPSERIDPDSFEFETEFSANMEEIFGEDTIVNLERYQERYEQKWLPRISKKQVQGNEHNQDIIFSIKDGQMPAFQVQQSPFQKQRMDNDSSPDRRVDDIIQDNQSNNPIGISPGLQNGNQISEFTHIIVEKQQEQQQPQLQQELQQQEKLQNDVKQVENQQETENKVVIVDQQNQEALAKNNITPQGNGSQKEIPENLSNEEESSSDDGEFGDGDTAIVKAKVDYEYVKMNKQEINQWIHNFKYFESNGEERIKDAFQKGGKICTNKEIINTMRSVGKYIISQIGRKIISGDFNLTTVSFPIKAMIPKSALQTILYGTVLFPYYINMASQIDDKIQRFKLLITASLGNFPVANGFLKPLNPILGETFQGSYSDGTKCYGEQISHHPPISYFLTIGPNKSYTYNGYYLYDAKAGFNSLTLKNRGKRKMVFHKDNQTIHYDYGYEQYNGTFMGNMRHETLGSINFEDRENNIKCTITFGKVKKKPSDYFSGEITLNGSVISKCQGSYNGFIEFDGIRYWDFRFVKPFVCKTEYTGLQSDHSRRADKIELSKGQITKAQKEKENLEALQRADGKLRKATLEQKAKLEKQQKKLEKKKK